MSEVWSDGPRMAECSHAAGDESAAEARRALTRDMWRGRLRGVQRNVEVWQALLSVRTLVLPMHQDTHTWLKFASLCRKSARPKQSRRTLQQLLGYDPAEVPPGQPGFGGGSGKPDIMFGFVKHLWQCNDRHDALSRHAPWRTSFRVQASLQHNLMCASGCAVHPFVALSNFSTIQ